MTLSLFLGQVGVAWAQTQDDQVFAEPERQLLLRLDMAKDLNARERYSEAIQTLTTVLESPEDYLILPTDDDQDAGAIKLSRTRPHTSFKAAARRLIAELPEQARHAYELQFGETARRRLNVGLAAGDMDAVALVARKFPHTAASREALMLLGYDHMSRGRFLAAAFCFDHVYETDGADAFEPMLSVMLWNCWMRSGKPARAEGVRIDLHASRPDAELELGGDRFAVFAGELMSERLVKVLEDYQPVRKFDAIDWTLAGGDASRTATSSGGRPLLIRPRWRQRITNDAATLDMVERARVEYSEQAVAAVPAAYPLALRDLILMRSPDRLVAVDFETGKRRWQIEDLEPLSTPAAVDTESVNDTLMRQRVWQDRTFGTISSDGSTVFAIEREASPVAISSGDLETGGPATPDATGNVLVAYDVAVSEGKRAWAVGGIRGVEPRLENAIFLGPPLPLNERLYVLVEQEDEVRLAVLNAKGKLQWSQQLAAIIADVPGQTLRRTSGLSPSAAENILVCPTGVGAIVAVDLSTRDLLWGYRYDRPERTDQYGNRFGIRQRWAGQVAQMESKPGMLSVDDCVTIAEGHVLATPSDSNVLHCLELATGNPHWTKEQGANNADLYVATVYGDQVVVVSGSRVAAIDLLSSRRREFAGVNLKGSSAVSGRGFRAGDRYYLPTAGDNGGELLILNLADRRLEDRVRTGDGSIPGNLICYRGQIVSQGTDYLERFDDLETLKRRVHAKLAEDPDDPWARTSLAETHAEAEEHPEAIKQLRRARSQYSKMIGALTSTDPRREELGADQLLTRQLLFNSLLASLESDFAANREFVDEAEPLISTTDERVTFLRTVAAGRHESGEVSAALQAYLDLIEVTRDEESMVKVSVGHSVRHVDWIRARLATLSVQLDDTARRSYDAQLQVKLAALDENATLTQLNELLSYYGDQSVAGEIRRRVLDGFGGDLSVSKRVALLGDLVRYGSVNERQRATAELARLYSKSAYPAEAMHFYRRLANEWKDTVVADGKTGAEIVASLRTASRPGYDLHGLAAWPAGAVKQERVGNSNRHSTPMVILSRESMHAEGLSLALVVENHSSLKVELRDGLGQVQWAAALPQEGNRYSWQFAPSARLSGNRVVLEVGGEVVVLDRVKKDATESSVAWRAGETTQSSQYARQFAWSTSQQTAQTSTPFRQRPWSDRDPRHQMRAQRPRFALGPVTRGGVTHLSGRDLVSLDLDSGDPRWKRQNLIRKGHERFVTLFGDDEVIVAAYRRATSNDKDGRNGGLQGEATIVRTLDGATLVETARIPPPDRLWATHGRMILEWRSVKEKRQPDQLVLFDPLEQTDVWSHDIERGARGALVGQDQVAVMETNGRLRIFDIATGNVHLERELTAEPKLRGLYVVRDPSRYMVLANQRQNEETARRSGVQTGEYAHFTGRVYCLDRQTGEPQWRTSATLEDQWVMLDQPTELPVLVFTKTSTDTRNKRVRYTMIDKRTGATAGPTIDVSGEQYASIFHGMLIAADYDDKTIRVGTNRGKFAVVTTFTDEPSPPRPPVQFAELDPEPKIVEGNEYIGKFLRLLPRKEESKKSDEQQNKR